MKTGIFTTGLVGLLASLSLSAHGTPAGQQAYNPAKYAAAQSALLEQQPKPAAACSPLSLREAAAKGVAPELKGCQLGEVAPILMEFYQISPATTEVADSSAKGIILDQTPAAGEPLTTANGLAVTISTGQPAEVASSSESSSESSSSESSSQSAMSSASVGADLGTPTGFPLWGYIAAGVAIVVALLTGVFMRSGAKPAPKAVAPIVTCQLAFGPGRLESEGPLIEGPSVGVSIALDLGPPSTSDITVLDEGQKE